MMRHFVMVADDNLIFTRPQRPTPQDVQNLAPLANQSLLFETRVSESKFFAIFRIPARLDRVQKENNQHLMTHLTVGPHLESLSEHLKWNHCP